MRWFLLGCTLLLSWQAGPFGSQTVDLRGRALLGDSATKAVVWLEAPNAPRPPQTVVLDQKNLSFDPGMIVVPTGSTVVFPNNDRVLHNVFSFHDGKRFDLGTYPVGQVRRVLFDVAGVNRVFCNIHPAMAAYIIVVDTPYYALTDRDGTFVLRDVPPGRHRYHAWRSGSPMLSGEVSVGGSSVLEVRWPAR